MTVEHTRPLVAYLCLALSAALLLVQGAFPAPTHVTSVLGDAARTSQLAGATFYDIAERVVLTPSGNAGVATVGEPAGRQTAETTVITKAPVPAASANRTPTRSTGTAQPRTATKSSATPQRAAKPRPSAKTVRPGNGKGNARGAQRSSPRDARTSPRTSLRTAKVRGHGGGKGNRRAPRR